MIKVDENKCIGCGLCANMCGDTFEMNDENISKVISQKDHECAENAASSCPVLAILID